MLGLIALKAGDVGQAKEYLLEAGRVTGSSVLVSFGPNMRLAKQLIEKGERDTAIEYFNLCMKFWKREDGKLEKWKNIVKQGGMPDFGLNFSHLIDIWLYDTSYLLKDRIVDEPSKMI